MTGRSRRSRTACATEDQSPMNTKTKKTKNQRTTARPGASHRNRSSALLFKALAPALEAKGGSVHTFADWTRADTASCCGSPTGRSTGARLRKLDLDETSASRVAIRSAVLHSRSLCRMASTRGSLFAVSIRTFRGSLPSARRDGLAEDRTKSAVLIRALEAYIGVSEQRRGDCSVDYPGLPCSSSTSTRGV